jgi:hypothetical protein
MNLADSDFAAQVKMTASDRYEQSDEVAGRVSYLVSSESDILEMVDSLSPG